ncbi:MAG: AtpZ/AtpI family protein [Candidatus Scalindua sp.]|nr:AtpZ/AtpI family protein [Candidatus Scalindua sp.]MCR4345131.1 AtpZ/AtpI family protein [Candidatus Scalindua sp.]
MNLDDSRSTYRALGLTSGIGFIMAACLAGGYFGGRYLDSKFGTEPWLLIASLLLCLTAGIVEICNMLKKAMKELERKDLED